MTGTHGMLSLEDLAEDVRQGAIDTVLVAFADPYGRLMGKRFDAEYFVTHGAAHGTHACDYLLTADMEMEPVQGYAFANWQLGYGDVLLRPDLATLRRASWLDRSALVLCDVATAEGEDRVEIAPRTMLRRQIERAAALGFLAEAASELEYYVFEDAYRDAAELGYRDLTPMGWYLEDYHLLQGTREERFTAEARRHLRSSGVPVENSKGEWGRGQHEVNVRHADVLAMADRHTVFKQAFKEIAERLGVSVTFMAKPAAGQAGSSCHLHLSLWHEGTNAFAGTQPLGPVRGSDAFRHFLAGWMAHADEFMVFYAPTVNSYKRFEDGSWAPTRAAWSYDNRTAGFRVVGREESLRIECRIPGADVNPYLAFTAALASGLDGIERRLEPPALYQGDVYEASDLPRFPRNLDQAVRRFEASDFAREALGADVVEHYVHFYRTELAAFERAVTDWERQRYFERI
ncbi:MAG: glutamine synthetase family protein [Deinococcales bacterium]